MPASAAGRGKSETMAELALSLLKLDGEKIEVASNSDNVISNKDLETLLDRSPEVFSDRCEGWTSGNGKEQKKAAFAVYKAQPHEANDALAKAMGEEMEC
jgi:ATP-dependent DNA helicase